MVKLLEESRCFKSARKQGTRSSHISEQTHQQLGRREGLNKNTLFEEARNRVHADVMTKTNKDSLFGELSVVLVKQSDERRPTKVYRSK